MYFVELYKHLFWPGPCLLFILRFPSLFGFIVVCVSPTQRYASCVRQLLWMIIGYRFVWRPTISCVCAVPYTNRSVEQTNDILAMPKGGSVHPTEMSCYTTRAVKSLFIGGFCGAPICTPSTLAARGPHPSLLCSVSFTRRDWRCDFGSGIKV